jgi:hypothetical protein
VIVGCTDSNNVLFDSAATDSDGSCEPSIYGCTGEP